MKIDRKGEIGFNNFGSLMYIYEYRNANDIDIYFPHRDWTAKHVTYQHFKDKSVKCVYEPRLFDKGYVGEGKYNTYENGKITKMCSTWKHMIQRCYDPKYHEKQPTYIDCEVCDEWLNFQNFAEWYEENYYEIPGEQMNLDKDILVKGNKIYSPDTCVFVPRDINLLFVRNKSSRGDLPIGVVYDARCSKYRSVCHIRKTKHIGMHNTPEEAFMAYKTFKEAYIKQIADEYADLIPQKLYDAMYDYDVEYED